jgi:hypothetical protein
MIDEFYPWPVRITVGTSDRPGRQARTLNDLNRKDIPMSAAKSCVLICLYLIALGLPRPSLAGTVYLDATFDDKTIDAPIGIGGAAHDEPYYVEVAGGAYVRSSPMATPSLELRDGSDCCWQHIWFSFLNNAKITTGTAVITLNLWIAETPGPGGDHRVEIRQFNPDNFTFLTLYFLDDGWILLIDANGFSTTLGQYETGRAIPLAFAVDLDTSSYDIWIDSALVLDDQPITLASQGVEGVVFLTTPDEDLTGRFYIDDLHVTDDPAAVPARRATWGTIRCLFAE